MDKTDIILEAKGIVKRFPGVKALSNVDIKIKKGEVHALCGENGAGKSTLMLTLGGIYKPECGSIYLEGEEVFFNSPQEANAKGIAVVYQELSLVPNLSVAENIFANRQPLYGFNIINSKRLYDQTMKMLSLFNIENIDPFTLVKNLSMANQQVVEILKAMSFNPKILILDEPTSSLTETEVEQLFGNIKILKEKGISFIYISHHLSEIFKIADSVTVLRDGQFVCTSNVSDIDEDFLVQKMVGRKIEKLSSNCELNKCGEKVLEVKDICKKGVFTNISFEVAKGEIVGFAGLIGAGRTEVGRAIFGSEPFDSGEITLYGKKIKIKSPQNAIENGIGYMTEDRKNQGLYLNFTIQDNMIANHLKDFTKGIFLKEDKIKSNAENSVEEFAIATPNIYQKVCNLSGGNQQKVLLSEWFGINPKVLIVDEPTRGVDVGAKSDIYMLLRKLATSGVAVIMISSDLLEVIGVSDRIVVMKDGRVAGEILKKDVTEEKVIAMATGVRAN